LETFVAVSGTSSPHSARRTGKTRGSQRAEPPSDQGDLDEDHVDAIVEQWRRERPDLEPSPMAIFGRVSRIHTLVRLAQNVLNARHDMSSAAFDVLANLRRSGAPHRKSASTLATSSMISTGGVTFRLDALESAGLIRRVRDLHDRRVVHAELTPKGLRTIDEVIEDHLELEHSMLARMSREDRQELTRLLTLLEGLVSDHTCTEAPDDSYRGLQGSP
jgi:DNA-binding MarR family transcriptional regulator